MATRQRKIYSLGIDGGNSFAKGAMLRGKRIVTVTFPSLSAPGDLNALARSRSADGARSYIHPADMLEADEYVLSSTQPDGQYTQEEFFGQLAMHERPYAASSGRNDPSRAWSGRLRKLCFVLAGTLIPEQEAELFLVTGLPTKTFSEQTRRQVIESLAGDHRFHLNGHKRRLILPPEHIRVVQEGAAAARALAQPISGLQGTIDPGGYSTEFVVLSDMQMIADMSGGIAVGVENIADTVEQAYREHYHLDQGLSGEARNGILHAWADPAHVPYPQLFIDRATVPSALLHRWTQQAINQVGEHINEWLRQHWKYGEQGKVATTFAQVNIIGGGSWYFKHSIEQLIPHLQRPADPELCNVKSYALLAAKMQEKAMIVS